MITKPFLLSARLCAEHFTNGSPFNCHNCPKLWNGVSELYFKDGETSPDRPPLEHRDPPPGSRRRFWAWHSRPLPLPTSFVLWTYRTRGSPCLPLCIGSPSLSGMVSTLPHFPLGSNLSFSKSQRQRVSLEVRHFIHRATLRMRHYHIHFKEPETEA